MKQPETDDQKRSYEEWRKSQRADDSMADMVNAVKDAMIKSEAAKVRAMQDAQQFGIGFLRIDADGVMTRIDPQNIAVDPPKEGTDNDG
jgi:hypothetical protein